MLVLVSSESLGLLGGDDGTTLDDGCHDTSDGLNTKGKGSHIDEKNVGSLFVVLTTENTTLDSGTIGDSLIRVDTSVGLFAVEEILDELLDLGDTSGATNEDDLVNLAALETGVIDNSLDWLEGVLEKITAELLELGTSQSLLEVDAVDEAFNEDLNLLDGGKVSLCFLNLGLELLESAGVSLDVNTVLLLERLAEMIGDTLIEIFTTEMGITSSGEHLKDTVIDSKDGHIKGTTTEIEDNDVLLVLFVEAISDGSGGRLVDDTEDLETSDSASILGSLSLGIVEVSGHGDDGMLDVLTEVVLSDLLHLGEDHGGNFFGGELLEANISWHLD